MYVELLATIKQHEMATPTATIHASATCAGSTMKCNTKAQNTAPNWAVKPTPILAMASPFSWPALVPYAPTVLRRRLP